MAAAATLAVVLWMVCAVSGAAAQSWCMTTLASATQPAAIGFTSAPLGQFLVAEQRIGTRVFRNGTALAAWGKNGISGYSGDGGLALAATVTAVNGVAAHPGSGDIYLSDSHRVRWIFASNASIRTLAGSDTASLSGDDGSLLVVDSGNHRVRIVFIGGNLTIATLIGSTAGYADSVAGPGSVHFTSPRGIALDETGTGFFITEPTSHRVRRVFANLSSLTYLGTGAASSGADGSLAWLTAVNQPTGVAYDRANRTLFVAEYSGLRIRAVSLASNLVTTLVGSGVSGNAADNVAATTSVKIRCTSERIARRPGSHWPTSMRSNCISPMAGSQRRAPSATSDTES